MEEKKDPATFSNLNNSNTISSDDSNNPLHIEKYLAEWEKICIEFFNNGNKTNEIVIRLVENGKITNSDIKTIDFSVIEEENPTIVTKEELENMLKKIGFVNGVIVHPGKYHEIKRKARSDWHKQKALELIQELDRLLHCRPAQYTPPHRRSELSGYVNQYKESIGAKPFIKGLSKALQLQLSKPSLVSWTFLDDTLTQNGVDFMRATVNLLVNVLGFTHTIQEVDESGEQGNNSLRTWYFNSNIDDKEIRSLLELLPKERSSMLNNVRITGTIELSSQPRPSRMIKSSPVNIIWNVIFFPLKLLFLWFRLFKWCISLCVSICVSSIKRESARDGTLSEIRV